MSDFSAITKPGLANMPDHEFRGLLRTALSQLNRHRQEQGILDYQPVSDRARQIHQSTAHWIGASGGNGSSKTESVLVEIISLATGVFPDSIAAEQKLKFRGPINVRIVVESLTNTLYPIILPKLIWNRWTGIDQPGGVRGHWGWIPRMCLLDGAWDRSWSAATRMLRFYCRDPEDANKVIGESTVQFMSHDNDPEDFASGDFHIIMLDEPPSKAVWRESQARTMRTDGRIILAMTWPDDPSAPVDWIFDEIYDKGTPGNAAYDPDFEWIELLTTENQMLDQDAIARQARNWDAATRAVRHDGKPLRFSNLVHSVFTPTPRWWCFTCNDIVGDHGLTKCPNCGGDDVEKFCHVGDFFFDPTWPVIWCIDPHPRKPHFVAHIGIDPNDDLHWLSTMEIKGDADAVYKESLEREMELDIRNVVRYLGDPRMLGSPTTNREKDWEHEFQDAGIPVVKADPSDIGRESVNTYLKPDIYLRRPRMHFHPRCVTAISQFRRFAWDEFKGTMERAQKQTVRDKNDDYPAIARYVMNDNPSFETLMNVWKPLKRPGTRRGAY